MNEQSNRRAMIRRVRAMSSVCYPEVFHRFCGYLCPAPRNFFSIDVRALSSRETTQLSRVGKKNSRARCCTGLAEDVVGLGAGRVAADTLVVGLSLPVRATLLLREPCSGEIHGENAVACAHQIESPAVGPVAQWLVQGTHRQRCLRGESREVDGMNSGNPSGRATDGNPEPSRRYTAGRCRDYLRAAG
jgi:hypothetical protein